MVLNCRFTTSIAFHNIIRGFRSGCGTGTTSLKSKLLHQLTAMREEVLYTIFLDLHRSYATLDSDRCLEILEGYSMVPQAHRVLREYWDRLRMVARVGGYYGVSFQGFRGLT